MHRSHPTEWLRFDRIWSDVVSSPERVSASPTCVAVETGVTGFPLRREHKRGNYFVTVLGQAHTIGRLGPLFSLGGVP
jgi:hypothetical protein